MRRVILLGLLGLLCAFAWVIWSRSTIISVRAPNVSRAAQDTRTGADTGDDAGADTGSARAEAPLLRGRLVEWKTGVPIEGAQIIVDHRTAVWSDARGEFDIPCAPDAMRADFRILPLKHGSIWTNAPLRRDQLIFELEPGLLVSGVVRTRNGDMFAGVRVTTGTSETWTDAQGRFSLGGHMAGELEISCLGTLQSAQAGDAGVAVVVDGSYLQVVLRDDSGKPVREVRTEGFLVESGHERWLDYFFVRHEPGESVEGVVRKEGFLPARLRWTPRSAAPGLNRTELVLQRRPDNALAIRVQRADGSFASTAQFTLIGDDGLVLIQETVSLKQGRGRVEGVPVGAFTASVYGDQDSALGVRQPLTIQPGDENEAQFDLPPGTRLQVLWTKYSTKYRLEIRLHGTSDTRYQFGQYPGKELWGSLSRLPYGRYRLVELRLDDVIRECTVDLSAEAERTVDWSKKQ